MNDDQQDLPHSLWSLLPIPVWVDIVLDYLTLPQERALVNTCRWTRFILSAHLAQSRNGLRLVRDESLLPEWYHDDLSVHPVVLLLQHVPIVLSEQMVNIQFLDLGEYATDEALSLLHGYMPLLHTLLVAHNYGVSNAGLADIGADTNRCLNLKLLDITLCNASNYSGTLLLRRQLRHPELVIRRQPEWMDGKYATPDGFLTCWADGSFEYE
jgi:hypothetical protein